MKNIKLTVLGIGIFIASTSFSQDQKTQLNKEKRMEMRMDKIATELALTDVQKEQMAVLRKNAMEERQKIKNDANLDEEGKKMAVKELKQESKGKIAEILTEDQQAKLKVMKQEQKAKKAAAKKEFKMKELRVAPAQD